MLFSTGSLLMLITIFGIPLVATYGLVHLASGSAWVWPTLLVAPLVYTVCFVLTAGGLSLPFQSGIVAGTFPRDLGHPVYRKRRFYGLCWTSVYYFKPLYYLCLGIPWLKWLLFRLFGYKGRTQFTIYPDTWIRDLPLLSFGENAYISNRATLGTNIALSNGQTFVDAIKLGPNSVVGHLAMLAPGVELDERAEIAVGCAIGIRCKIGRGALVQPTCAVNHHVVIEENSVVGSMSYVGLRARIGASVKLPPGSLVPARRQILSQSDAAALISSEREIPLVSPLVGGEKEEA